MLARVPSTSFTDASGMDIRNVFLIVISILA